MVISTGFALLCGFLISTAATAKNTKLSKDDSLNQAKQIWDSSYLQVQADSLFLKGEKAFSSGQWSEGVQFLKQAISYNPGSTYLRQRLAEHYTTAGLWTEASAQYEAALEKNPLSHSIRHRLAEIYAFNNLTGEALKHYAILLKRNPDNFPSLFQYARLLIKEKKWSQALKILKTAKKRASGTDQQIEILLAEISVYGSLNLPQQQKKRLARAKTLQPHREDLALKLAYLYTQFAKPALAINVLQDYQNRHRSPLASQTLADLFMVLNQKTKALQQLLKLKDMGALNPSRYFYLAGLLIERKEYERAIPFLRDLLIRPSPLSDRFHYMLGTVYEKQGKLSQALKEYENIPAKSNLFVSSRIQQAQILRDQGKESQALTLLEPVIFIPRQAPRALLLYTHLLWKKQKTKKTLNVLTEGLKHFPQHRDILFLRGLSFSRVGKFQNALKDMEQILNHNPRDEEALRFLANLYIKENQNLDRVETLARQALSLHPNSSSLLDTLGWTLFQKGEFKPALKYLSRAYSQNNQSSHIATHLGEIYYQLKDLEKSRFFFEKAALLEANEKRRKEIQQRAHILQEI